MHARTTRMAAASGARSLSSLRFDNRALRVLPVDADATNSVRDPVADACFSRVKPTPVDKPRMVAASESALALLGLPLSEAAERADGAEYLSGNKLPDGADPVANCYCGYQFGYFSGQLGDGAAMTLGEVVNDAGERYELQLKGAGKTPYSRTADGRKVLRSSLREFLCSEAMHSLGVPTTRAGSVVTSDSTIVRDVFYTGRPEAEQCSVITRMAPTFLRFGSFEIFKAKDPTTGRAGPSPGNLDLLNRMVDYTCNAFFKDIVDSHAPKGLPLAFPEEDGLPGPKLAGTEAGATTVFEVYKEVLRRTARMVAKWQMVGWCHGVLNTDNMSILGLTLDYGPFAFMDRFDWDFICNTSDDSGRYTYRRQPEMCRWNCKQLGVAWSPAMPGVEWEAALETAFDDEFALAHLEGARAKLGLSADADGASGDAELFESLLDTMAATGADFTRTFRTLMDLGLPAEAAVGDDLSEAEAAAVERVAAALSASLASREDLLTAIRPRIEEERVNMLLQLAPMDSRLRPHIPLLEKEAEAWVSYNRETSLSPEAKAAENKERWSAWLRQFAIRLRGEAKAVAQSDRVESMRLANPKFVLRNYLCQVAIRAAEDGDFSEARRLLARVQDPFDLDKAIPSTIGDAGVELQKSGKVRGGNLVDMSDAPPAEAKSASAAAGAAAKGAGSCNVAAAASDAAMAPAFATSYDGMPPKWACKLRVSCSS